MDPQLQVKHYLGSGLYLITPSKWNEKLVRLMRQYISYLGCQLGDNGKVWELGGLWNWIINKKSRGSKLNFPNEWVE